jgi:hypothetical protein
MQATS